MGLSVYKSGQGYWTRVMTAVAAATLSLAAVAWFNEKILQVYIITSRSDAQYLLYWKAGLFAGVALAVGAALWYVLNKPRIADFMIATENEMKKVNWPSRQAVIGLTWVVIFGTLLIALLLFLVNTGFTYLFQEIGILDTGG